MSGLAHEFNPQNRAVKFLRAADPAAWPRAASSMICIFEAVQFIGRAKHGSDWTGTELSAIVWPESPKAEYARQMLPFKKVKPPPSFIRDNVGRSSLTREETSWPPDAHVVAWYVELRQARWEANRAKLFRLIDTVEWIAQRCRDDDLKAYARFRSGGGLWPMDAWEWNQDNPLEKFVSDGGHKRYFTTLKSPASFDVFIFFERGSVEQLAAGLSHCPLAISETDLNRLSPFLRLAVNLALARGYTSEADDETQPIREAEVKAAWQDALPNIPWSETAAHSIARVMGFPNAKAIEQGRKAILAKKGG